MKPLRLLVVPALGLLLALLPACSNEPKPAGSQAKGPSGGKGVVMVGLWAYNPPAILSALKDSKDRLGKVKVVGFDENEDTLQGIADGHIYATVVQDPYNFGYHAVRLMASVAKGDRSVLPKDGNLYFPHRVITKDGDKERGRISVAKFRDDWQKILAQKGGATAAAGGPKVAFVTNNPESFWSIAEVGCRKAEKEFGVEVLFRKPESGDPQKQDEILDNLVNQDIKALAVSVINPVGQRDHLKEIIAKVPLLTQDNDAPDSGRLCYIGTNNYTAGREVGRLVKEALPEGGTLVVFVGQTEPLNARQRRQGMLDELAGSSPPADLNAIKPTPDGQDYGKYRLFRTYTDQPVGYQRAVENAADALTQLKDDGNP
jgi:ribose transport system substrate-binding protein